MKVLHLVTNNKNCDLCGVISSRIGDRVNNEKEFKRNIHKGYVPCTSMVLVDDNKIA